MRLIIAALAIAIVANPASAGTHDIPLVAIGLPFTPETPVPVAATHPLYHQLAVGEIEGLPGTVGSSRLNFIKAAKGSSVNAGLRETFERMNMLAADPASARAHLVVTWGESRTPFKIGGHNTSTATLRYQLIRNDNGKVLFDRQITTSAEGSGADASMRDNSATRAAIAANFASAANCLDRASTGPTPADCALTPKYSVIVTRQRR